MEAFEKWAVREGYATGDKSKWEFDAVPKGGKLGEITLSQAWKASAFDRWRMTWHGLKRVTPHLVLQTISSDKPVETIIDISVGAPPTDPQLRQNWKALLDSLASAIKGADTNGVTRVNVASVPTASEILYKMEQRYDSLSSFSGTGKVVSDITPAGGKGTNSFLTQHTFALKLARPDFYRIEWTQKAGEFYTNRGAVWNSGNGHHFLLGTNNSSPLDRELTLSMATGVSGGAAHRMPSLFFKDKTMGWLSSLKNPSSQADEKIDGEDCYTISGDDSTGREILWITKKISFLSK